MDLNEWTYEYLKRNAKLRGWEIESADVNKGIFKIMNKNGESTYVVSSDLSLLNGHIENYKGESLIVVCHNKNHNLAALRKEAQSIADKAHSVKLRLRILFANTDTDQFWTANITMMHSHGTIEHLIRNITSYIGEVPLMQP